MIDGITESPSILLAILTPYCCCYEEELHSNSLIIAFVLAKAQTILQKLNSM